MIRKQVLLTSAQIAYLAKLKEETGESEGHFIRQALEEHAALRGKEISKIADK